MAGDEEFPPLLTAGLQKMPLAELYVLVVSRFPTSKQRQPLWNNLTGLIDQLKALGLPCEIWVDGSSLTEKIDPKDVDFVVDFPINVINALTPDQKKMLEDLGAQEFKQLKKLHSFVMFTAPKGHSYFAASEASHNQWKRDFGYSYIKKEPKGIAVVEVTP